MALFAASAMASSTFEQSLFVPCLASVSSSPNFVAGKSSSALKIASGVDIFVDSSSSSDWNEKNGETAPTFVDDGTKIEFKDFLCFAEKVHNKY